MDDRLTELEIRYTFLADRVAALEEVLDELARRVDELAAQLRAALEPEPGER